MRCLPRSRGVPTSFYNLIAICLANRGAPQYYCPFNQIKAVAHITYQQTWSFTNKNERSKYNRQIPTGCCAYDYSWALLVQMNTPMYLCEIHEFWDFQCQVISMPKIEGVGNWHSTFNDKSHRFWTKMENLSLCQVWSPQHKNVCSLENESRLLWLNHSCPDCAVANMQRAAVILGLVKLVILPNERRSNDTPICVFWELEILTSAS